MPQLRTLGLAAAPLALLVLAVLYGMSHSDVHAPAPPASLAPFAREAKPLPAPPVSFSDAAGKSHALSEFRGRYVLLNVWATWCAPCVRELPALAALKGAVPNLTVLAVDATGRSETASQSADFLKGHKAGALGTHIDSDAVFISAFHAYGLPLTVLIDPQGNEIGRAEGPAAWDAPAAIAYFRDLTRIAKN